MLTKGRLSSFLLSLPLFLSGCADDGPELSTVTGVVTLDGKPAQGLTIRFVPQKEGASPSYGSTNAEGKYELFFTMDKPGAVPGTHVVEIEPPEPAVDENGKPVGPPPLQVPRKYRTAGTLTAEVKPGANSFDFPLDSK
ncbi:MAG: hypothetical protein JNM43_08200 [Planctomycetaceae bacterium]|nr:hypothetical protein [Planctomycetaceae bacterium]